MNDMRIRIGIDVGGTFTHAVAIDHADQAVIAHSVIPTTHSSEYGVSEGIVEAFEDVLRKTHVRAEDVVFVAHSTTQATNALLEGDVAKVGIIGMGKGYESIKAKRDTNIKSIELSHGKYIKTAHNYIDTAAGFLKDEEVDVLIGNIIKQGCEVMVASEAFGVDDPSNELKILELAAKRGLPATASHEISLLYGLKTRTRTAVINASILPKMTQTADMTEKSIIKSGIKSPLMIMRSDGGVMDINQMRKRPALTMLSGPAAGIAAALMFAKISDGIFLEVGGTSTDISAIKNGRAMIKSAKVGGHTTYLKTLDSRTLGIGGGSMARIKDSKVFDVGPRSAHIAGFPYITFSPENEMEGLKPVLISPRQSDPDDYLVLENSKGRRFALTLTDASIMAGMSKEGDYAFGNLENVRMAFEVLGRHFGRDPLGLAHDMLDKAVFKVSQVVWELLSDYSLDPELIFLVGGGGAATTVVPWLSRKIKMQYVITEHAEVISAIGSALAMLRDVIEKTVIDATEEDIIAIRKQAQNSLVKMGADINTVDVSISIDNKKNILSAVATGSLYMENQPFSRSMVKAAEAAEVAAKAMRVRSTDVALIKETEGFWVFSSREVRGKFFGTIKTVRENVRIVDKYGIIRLQVNGARYVVTKAERAIKDISTFIKEVSDYNDAGMIVPNVFLIYVGRIADLSTLMEEGQIMNMVSIETKGLGEDEAVIVISQERAGERKWAKASLKC